ncbi:MAG: hypothetical protein LBB61_02005, partial [Treponema sp.]|nr:hypothetical protein [Treponema sp.]
KKRWPSSPARNPRPRRTRSCGGIKDGTPLRRRRGNWGPVEAGGTADEGAGIEGSKEEEQGEHDGLKTFTACGGEPVEPGV